MAAGRLADTLRSRLQHQGRRDAVAADPFVHVFELLVALTAPRFASDPMNGKADG